jgi:predicted 3-demethylubiquinone-9 3-methyltransferase (glyoxalase superfamily)
MGGQVNNAAKPGITPFLWFDGDVEEAAKFYLSAFEDGRLESVHRPAPGKPAQSATLALRGQRLHLFNGGPHYKLTPAFSFMVDCEGQAEVDGLWAKLTAGGKESRCGWLEDRYGLSWQIVPTILIRLLRDPNPAKANAAMQAMLQMGKLDIERLQQASDQA